ncbi:MAG TPA: hypothetical protein ENJ32_02730 [Crenotrichaceae bacterium]|nr:hypothetical protein [Crenotrichaceae bacterium]
MMNTMQPVPVRRRFLQSLMLAVTGGTLLGQSRTVKSDNYSTQKLHSEAQQSVTCGYHETEHIRRYYQSVES